MANEYTVIHGNSTEDLIRKVNTAIKEGWQPLGGASATIQGNNAILTQAMIK